MGPANPMLRMRSERQVPDGIRGKLVVLLPSFGPHRRTSGSYVPQAIHNGNEQFPSWGSLRSLEIPGLIRADFRMP